MTSIRRLACALVLVLAASACGGDGDVVVDEAREASTGADGGTETIQAPDFEVELEPGQDPDDVLAGPTPTSPPGPADAIAVLCPAVEALVADTADDADRDAIRAATPPEWADLVADLRDPSGRSTDPAIAPLDRWFFDTCSLPLFAAVDQLGAGCGDVPGCRGDRVDNELGGLCLDDEADGGGYRLLSCVSGLPIDG